MFETPLTVIGHIVNDPQRRKIGDQELIKFRLASNSRRRTPDGDWESGNSLFITVNCWGKLVTGVGAALSKGFAGHRVRSCVHERVRRPRRQSAVLHRNAGNLGWPGPVARDRANPETRAAACPKRKFRTPSRAPPPPTGESAPEQGFLPTSTEAVNALPVPA